MARKFQFEFETILRLRQQREEVLRQEFATAKRDAAVIKGQIRRMLDAMRLQNRWARTAIAAGQNLPGYRQALRDAQMDVLTQESNLAVAQQAMDAKRIELLEALKQRKAISRLRERLAMEHATQTQRTTVRDQDDLHATYLAARGQEECPLVFQAAQREVSQ